MIEAHATDAPRQRVCEAAMARCTVTTMGAAKRTKEGTERTVVVMLEFPGKQGKLPIRLTTDAATHLIARLTQSLGAALA